MGKIGLSGRFPYVLIRKNGYSPVRNGHVTQIAPKPGQPLGAERHYLSVAAIARNEGRYIGEWIDFHRAAGVEHFVIYDNSSTDDTADVLAPHVRDGLVTLIPWPWFCATHNPQSLAYAHALAHLAGVSRWVAFIDLDEFLFPKAAPDLRQVLAAYEDLPAVGVYWALFGTSGFATAQPGPVVETFLQRLVYPCDAAAPAPYPAELARCRDARHLRSIVQPLRVRETIGPHYFRTDLFPVLAHDENRREIRDGLPRRVSFEQFQINHYFSKSRAEFDARMDRLNVIGKSVRRKREALLALVDGHSVTDRSAVEFLHAARARPGSG